MSSRVEGFDVMDVSTSLLDDPKFRALARRFPDDLAPAFMAYVGTMADSWKAGERLTVDAAWPSVLPHSDSAVTALLAVKLLDRTRRVTVSAWRGYFEQARLRREQSRERWRRANERRSGKAIDPNGDDSAATSLLPRGANAVTAPPSVRPSVRPNLKKNHSPSVRGEKKGTNGRARPLSERAQALDALMQRDDDEPAADDWMAES